MGKLIDLTGAKFGRLKVINLHSTGKKTKWFCKCDCGNDFIAEAYDLKTSHTSSCGCLRNELSAKRKFKHGLKKHPLYGILQKMKDRCYGKNNPAYKYYGARGITVCNEWLSNPVTFCEWAVSSGWQKGLEIDREDNDGGYSPANCRIVTKRVNANNKRNNAKFLYNGRLHSVYELEQISGFPSDFILRRIRDNNWDVEKAITTPKKNVGRVGKVWLAHNAERKTLHVA